MEVLVAGSSTDPLEEPCTIPPLPLYRNIEPS
jgi:hypothetical protein